MTEDEADEIIISAALAWALFCAASMKMARMWWRAGR